MQSTPGDLNYDYDISENLSLANYFERIETFIKENFSKNPDSLRLKYSILKSKNVREWRFVDFCINQIEARQRFQKKFRSFLSSDHPLIFPSLLAGEQASNEDVATYHGNLLASYGNVRTLLDMTGGLGIDFMTMASCLPAESSSATAIEWDRNKALALEYNASQYISRPYTILNAEAIEAVRNFAEGGVKFDLLFVDPARRDETGGRIFDPKSCTPDIFGNKNLLFKVSDILLVKNSPMLDIRESIRIFGDVSRIFVVSVRNECKEVLVEMRRCDNPISISGVDINAEGVASEYSFTYEDIESGYSGPFLNQKTLRDDLLKGEGWLYEPSTSIMKIAAWNALAQRYSLTKFSRNCHVFYSPEKIEGFPGRRVRIEGIIDKKGRKSLKGQDYNIVCRNFSEKADLIAKNLKVKPSKDKYIYGVTVEGLKGKELPLLLKGNSE